MFGIGSTELLVILLVALIVLGPKSLSSVSRGLGKAVGEFRRVSTEFQRTLNVESAKEDLRQAEEKRKRQAEAGREAEEKPAAAEKKEPTQEGLSGVPADSPIAQAIARAKAEADGADQKMGAAAQNRGDRLNG